ncbi:MAG: hemerythrin domain-containing protein [Ideonella sp.]|nr:hemerythrin domain-containing protein [Ideonella sp.]MCC7456615.1 hemerythrin domain-containing protein [Nitrospira sp.]
MTPKPASASASQESPVQDFSRCHVGILDQLHTLGELPALLEPAARARRIAEQALRFFRDVVIEHHREEEEELFPAVLASAAQGEERTRVQQMVALLTAKHREVEQHWQRLEPKLKAVAKGQGSDLDPAELQALVDGYLAHARHEEDAFLPLAQTILGRNQNHLAALGMSMHLRHAIPATMNRLVGRI